MTHEDDLWQLVIGFLGISLLSVGGGIAALPEMHRLVVETHGWMDGLAFAKRYALAQAAPGPNVMGVGLFGWHVAGLTGMFAAMLAMCGPTSILAYGFFRLRGRLSGAIFTLGSFFNVSTNRSSKAPSNFGCAVSNRRSMSPANSRL